MVEDCVPAPAELERARARIADVAVRTPVLRWDESTWVKPEMLQPTGSFKVRGATNAVARLVESERPDGVVTLSAGNHGQGLALAAREAGIPAIVVMPHDSSPMKLAATLALGATVVSDGVTLENREMVLAEVADRTGFAVVHPFDDWDVIAGQATLALELLDESIDWAAVVVPIGGGGLIAGTALAVASRRPGVLVIGVEPSVADDARQSFVTGSLTTMPSGPTIADGARVACIGQRPFEVIVERGLVHDVVTVTDSEIARGVSDIARRSRLVAEPTAALAVAALPQLRAGGVRGPIAAVLTGGNVGLDQLAALLV